VPTWQQNFQRRYRLWDDSELAGFALSEDCQPDCDHIVSANVHQGEILIKPLASEDLIITLTDSSLALLKEAGVPEDVLVAIAHLKDHNFENESMLSDALLALLGRERLDEYQEVILQHSYVDRSLNASQALTYLRQFEGQNSSRQRNAWDNSLLSRENENAQESNSANTSRRVKRKTWLAQLRAFCDKWGLPRPRTLLLLLLLFYLTVSLIKHFVQSQQ
jgi:hypothetical protein